MINDNRINPRVPIDMAVAITLPNNGDIEVHSENISLSGIMIVANHDEFQANLHRKIAEHSTTEPELKVSFTMPRSDNKPVPIKTSCRAIHVRRISQDKYFIGLKFLKLSQSAAAAIQHHVNNNLD